MKKVIYIVSDIDKSLAFEWIAQGLDSHKIHLEFILLNNKKSKLEEFLKAQSVPVQRYSYQRGWRLIFSIFAMWRVLRRARPDVIHAHMRYANIIGITAGYFARVKRRIHTRHHSNSNHIYHPHAVKVDKHMSKWSTEVVSISKTVTKVLENLEDVPANKIVEINHGFDLSLFSNPNSDVVNDLKQKYNYEDRKPVVGVISRYIHWKGVEYGIEAFDLVLQKHPDALLILANANGPYKKVIQEKLKALPASSYVEIPFESEIAALYQLFDVFVHVPISDTVEAFGQTYVEALAAGVPSVFTLSGIANEIIEDRKNALVVPYKDSKAITDAIIEILKNKELREQLNKAPNETLERFALDGYIQKLENLYIDG